MFKYYADVNEAKYPQGAYDGDTIDFTIDCGFANLRNERIRVLGINTPELRGRSKEEGIKARDFTRKWLAEGRERAKVAGCKWPFTVQTEKADAFGRYLAYIVRVCDGASLTAALVKEGYPVYMK